MNKALAATILIYHQKQPSRNFLENATLQFFECGILKKLDDGKI